MKYFIAFITLYLLAFSASAFARKNIKVNHNQIPVIDNDFIQHHNSLFESGKATWQAGVNENFRGWSIKDAKKILGWKQDINYKNNHLPILADYNLPEGTLPANFSSAQNWPNCPTIGTIYNQADCGSCWAFGATESASDRLCISTNGAFNQVLSFANLVSCDAFNNGCDGGDAGLAWEYIKEHGLVTDACYPYYIPTCPPAQQPCLNFVPTPKCWKNDTCVNGDSWTTHRASSTYGVHGVTNIQADLFNHGSVEACFTVYQDFLSYKGGVYQHTSGQALGGHCVKIIGWGEENNTPYWLVNNSWTVSWGWNGQFKILRGADECGIESDVVAGLFSN